MSSCSQRWKEKGSWWGHGGKVGWQGAVLWSLVVEKTLYVFVFIFVTSFFLSRVYLCVVISSGGYVCHRAPHTFRADETSSISATLHCSLKQRGGTVARRII